MWCFGSMEEYFMSSESKSNTENLLFLRAIDGKDKEIKKISFFPMEGALEQLENIDHLGLGTESETIYIKMNEENAENFSGRYDVTFNIMGLGKQKLYNMGNIQIETLGNNTLRLFFYGAA